MSGEPKTGLKFAFLGDKSIMNFKTLPDISKSQHYVPKFYLKNFSGGNNKIHVFSKENNKKFCANISKIATENYFYKIPDMSQKTKELELTEEQKKQEIEKLLSSIDSKSSKALLKFLQNIKSCKLKTFSIENNKSMSLGLLEIDRSLRYNLSVFFVLQNFRTKEHRELIREFYTKHLTKFYQFMTEHSDEMKKSNDELKEMGIDPKNLKVVPKDEAINLFHLQSLLDKKHISGLSNILFNRKWAIGINNTNIPFFTSDHPLIKHNYKNTVYGGGYCSDEIIIPLTPKYVLIMVSPIFWKDITLLNNKNYMVQELKKENVIFYNHLQTRESYNYVFSNTNEFYMMQKYLKRNPEAKNPFRSRVKFN